MTRSPLCAAVLAAAFLASLPSMAASLVPAGSGRAPVVLISDSPAFDDACASYYSQGNDPEVVADPGVPESFCECLASAYADAGLGPDTLDFFARTYSDDLTTFIDEYPEGDEWMEQSFRADGLCKAE